MAEGDGPTGESIGCLLDVLDVPREVEAEAPVPWADRMPGDDREIVALDPVTLHPEFLRHDCSGCCVVRGSVQYP